MWINVRKYRSCVIKTNSKYGLRSFNLLSLRLWNSIKVWFLNTALSHCIINWMIDQNNSCISFPAKKKHSDIFIPFSALMFVCKFNMTKLPFVVCQYFVYRLITERIPMTWTWMISGFSSGTYNGRKVQFSLTQIIYAYIKICIYNVVLFLSSRAHELREVGLLYLFILKYHSDQNVNQ
jgi:hypothetical protein